MKINNRHIAIFLLIVAAAISSAALAKEGYYISDETKAFSNAEMAQIKQTLQRAYNTTGISFTLITTESETETENNGIMKGIVRTSIKDDNEMLIVLFKPSDDKGVCTVGLTCSDTLSHKVKPQDLRTIRREVMLPMAQKDEYAKMVITTVNDYLVPALKGEDISEKLLKLYSNKIVPKPAKDAPVVDYADLFSKKEFQAMTDTLEALSRFNGTQVVVVTVKSLAGETVEDYAQKLFDLWKIGDKKLNNGILILVKEKNSEGKGRVRIHTGYGAEGALPDAFCKRIIEDKMIPEFKDNDYGEGVIEAIKVIAPIMRGEYNEAAYLKDKKHDDAMSEAATYWLLGALVYVLAYFLFIQRQSNGYSAYTDPSTNYGGGGRRHSSSGSSWSSWSSSSSGGGGGYSYGGGSSGGGGASGSW